jgi:hypothetical protein
MKIRRITTAGAPLGAAAQTGELSGTSRVTAGTGLLGSRGFDRVPELPPMPGHGEETREHRRTRTRQEQSSLAGPAGDERESR